MKKIILVALLGVSIYTKAQEYVDRIGFKLESIADIDIGWMRIYKPTTPPAGKTLGNRVYSAKQIGHSYQFLQWMQQSYSPRGCLGNIGIYQNYIYKFSSTNSLLGNARNQHTDALPHMYGAMSKMYMFLKKDAQGKFTPQNNFAEYWRIEANQLQYISLPVSFISSAEEYYFLMPDYTSLSKGYGEDDKAASNLMGFANNENIAGYKHFYVPPKTIDDYPHYVVILTKDNNELPFEKVTIGEFFSLVEKQFPVWQKIEPLSEENLALARKNIARLKEKYRNKWNDVARLKVWGTDIGLYDFVNAKEGYVDMFDDEGGAHTTFPIQRVKKSALALCKTDVPQWLVIRWTMGMPTQAFNRHLHESILNNFDFKYVYDYFYNPEKVKGQPYKPLRSPLFKEAVVTTKASTTNINAAADKNVFYFEDFSTTPVGKKPIGWKCPAAFDGGSALISSLEGLDGNWVVMNGDYTIAPTQIKKPFPQDFTLSYELVAAQNFTWGAKGLVLQVSKDPAQPNTEGYLKLALRPGYDGRAGEVTLETKFSSPPGYSSFTKWFQAPGFSNNKKNNHVTVSIEKDGEVLRLYIDKNKIAEFEKAIPATHSFNAISFSSGSSGETNKYYVSNITITKN